MVRKLSHILFVARLLQELTRKGGSKIGTVSSREPCVFAQVKFEVIRMHQINMQASDI